MSINKWGFRTEQSTVRGYQPAQKESLPVPLLINGLTLWLDGDSAVLDGGNRVTDWIDKSASGNDFNQTVAGSRPTGVMFGNISAVSFGGDPDRLDSINGSIFTGNTGEVFAVYRDNGIDVFGSILLSSSQAATNTNRMAFGGTRDLAARSRHIIAGIAGVFDVLEATDPSLFGVVNITSFRTDGVNYSISPSGGSVDEPLQQAGAGGDGAWFADSASKDNTTIGCLRLNSTTDEHIKSEIFELVVFDGVELTEAERQNMFDYLNNKYADLL